MKNYKQIIETELQIWIQAYPENRRLLKRFADKIKFELMFLDEEKKWGKYHQ